MKCLKDARGRFLKGYRASPRTEFKKGHVSYSKIHPECMPRGEKHHMFGIHKYGTDSPHYGHRHSEETKKRISEIKKKNPTSGQFKKGNIPWTQGKHPSKKTKEKIGRKNSIHMRLKWMDTKYRNRMMARRKGLCVREKNPNWKGGKSYEPYTPLFNKQLKERIRVRDNFKCQICGVPEIECERRLSIHHIDYNKNNLSEDNLIGLCSNCHQKTNHNRKHWIALFQLKENLIWDKTFAHSY